MTEPEPIPSKEKQHLDQLCHQYDALWKHLEYIDSHVFKLVGIYLIFTGALLAKAELFQETKALSAIFVLIIGMIFFVFLHRISRLLQELKKKIIQIDREKQKLHGMPIIDALPKNYTTGPRTSEVSKYAVFVFSALLAIYFAFPSTNSPQKPSPTEPSKAHPTG
ncbi:hypothetical protein [Marichromatium sp. AB31]|uniref:hypothetical protein n=1 Tax=Marichromatium sp. AB31 TaxID=2483362 RepID=UPI0011CEA82B|nr:hypothetical protein [Marichromatium sp. AB31]